jgi:hypothetical protein
MPRYPFYLIAVNRAYRADNQQKQYRPLRHRDTLTPGPEAGKDDTWRINKYRRRFYLELLFFTDSNKD